jgi:hypothetical protein
MNLGAKITQRGMTMTEHNPDELDSMIAAGAFAEEDSAFDSSYQEWLDEQNGRLYAEYQMRRIAEQYGEDF